MPHFSNMPFVLFFLVSWGLIMVLMSDSQNKVALEDSSSLGDEEGGFWVWNMG